VNKDTFMVHAIGNNNKLQKMSKLGYWYFKEGCSYYHGDDVLLGNVNMNDV
jgi:hypothetical protein